MFEPFLTLGLMLIFIIGALFVEWESAHKFLWKRRKQIEAFLIILLFIFLVYGIFSDLIAARFDVWGYGWEKTMGIKIWVIPLEDFVFAIAITIVISIATILFARAEERRNKNILKEGLKDFKKGIKESERSAAKEVKLVEEMAEGKKYKKKRRRKNGTI
jgi:lycopene cyclase domain-containing protein